MNPCTDTFKTGFLRVTFFFFFSMFSVDEHSAQGKAPNKLKIYMCNPYDMYWCLLKSKIFLDNMQGSYFIVSDFLTLQHTAKFHIIVHYKECLKLFIMKFESLFYNKNNKSSHFFVFIGAWLTHCGTKWPLHECKFSW